MQRFSKILFKVFCLKNTLNNYSKLIRGLVNTFSRLNKYMWQFSRSLVQCYTGCCLLQCSGQSDNTAAQKIYNKHDHIGYSTPRYMQAVRNHIQVVARCDRSTPALAHDSTPCSSNGGLNKSSQRKIQARYDTNYDMQRKVYTLTLGTITIHK